MLRLPTKDDIDTLISFAKNFHEASPYRDSSFSEERTKEFAETCISGNKTDKIIILAENDEMEPIGMIVAASAIPVFTEDKTCMELAWWVEPEYRGKRVSLELLDAYEEWARRTGCKVIHLACLPFDADKFDKLYKRRGYNLVESSYIKEV